LDARLIRSIRVHLCSPEAHQDNSAILHQDFQDDYWPRINADESGYFDALVERVLDVGFRFDRIPFVRSTRSGARFAVAVSGETDMKTLPAAIEKLL
jgi:hypothetical protein